MKNCFTNAEGDSFLMTGSGGTKANRIIALVYPITHPSFLILPFVVSDLHYYYQNPTDFLRGHAVFYG